MNFSEALIKLKEGKALTRAGWNGKNLFIYFVKANHYPAQTELAKNYFEGRLVPYRSYIAMKTGNDEVSPWVASNSDLLEDDWQEVSL